MKGFLCLGLAVGLLLSGCGEDLLEPSEPSLTPEQIAQIEITSQHIDNVLLQADDPSNPETLETAKQVALSQSVVEQAFVVEDELVVKYKNGGFEVWAGDIPRITPLADMAELHKLTRSVLAKSLAAAAKDSVGTRQAVLINCLYDEYSAEYTDEDGPEANEIFNVIEEILIAKGFDVKRLNGGRANLSTLKLLSNCSVIVKAGHGGGGIGFFRYPYNTQTGELWSYGEGFLSDAVYNEDWRAGRIVYVHTPWGKGDEKTRKKNSKLFFGVTGKFWSHYYQNSHFNKALFFNLVCSGSNEDYRNELFKVGIKGYTGWSKETTISPDAARQMLASMAEGKTLQQAYDELPDDYKYEDKYDSRLWIGKDDGLNLTLGGPVIQEPQIVITFVSIPGGTFQMGDVENVGFSSEKPVHSVTVSSFEMSSYEITNVQYCAYLNAALVSKDIMATSTSVTGNTGPYSGKPYFATNEILYSYQNKKFTAVPDKENWAVVCVTWYGAKAFALYYGLDLPTESEWEYACRGGRQYKYGTDDGSLNTSKANYWDKDGQYFVAVGRYPANSYGLFDMSGNVEEWCHDRYGEYPRGSITNPTGAQTGSYRVWRGGSWRRDADACRSASRIWGEPWYEYYGGGFRVVRRAGGVVY